MSLHIYNDLEQGSTEWLAARCGLVTASTVGQLITKGAHDALTVDCPKCESEPYSPCISTARKVPTPIKTIHDERSSVVTDLPPVYRVANNDTSRALALTLAAERITGHVEMVYPNRAMQRGTLDEPYAREVYALNYAPVDQVGFMVRDYAGFQIGYSPDGLVGDDGLIEIKSREQKKHLATVIADAVPAENMAQIQAGLLVSGRDWCDYVSYCGGMPLWTRRVEPDAAWREVILDALAAFEDAARRMVATYTAAIDGRPQTERIDHFAELEIVF